MGNFEMFKNNCLRRSRPLPIRKRRGRFRGIFTCTKVRKNTYMVRKNTYEYSTFSTLVLFYTSVLFYTISYRKGEQKYVFLLIGYQLT